MLSKKLHDALNEQINAELWSAYLYLSMSMDAEAKALQVGEVVIRRQVVLIVEQLVGHAVVAGVNNDENIVAAHRLLDQTLGVAALEAGAGALDDKAIGLVAGLAGPAHQMLVDEVGQLLGARAGDEAQVSDLRLEIGRASCRERV